MAGLTWDDIIMEGSFGGQRFDFVSIREDHSNTVDTQSFPGVDVSTIVTRGRNSARWDIMAIFIEDDYPENMLKLADLLRGGTVRKFVHPIFGEKNAACERFTLVHDADDAADSATMQITLVEDASREGLVRRKIVVPVPAQASLFSVIASNVGAALATLEAEGYLTTDDGMVAAAEAVTVSQAAVDTLVAVDDDVSAVAIQATTNTALASIDEAVALWADYATTAEQELGAALQEMAASLRDLAQTLLEGRPQLSTFTVVADTNLLQLAHDFEQDPDELLTLNSFPDPSLITAGTKWIGYVE